MSPGLLGTTQHCLCCCLSWTSVMLRAGNFPLERSTEALLLLLGHHPSKNPHKLVLKSSISIFFKYTLFQSYSELTTGITGSIYCFRCDAGYTGQHCEKKDYSVLYVVPGPVRFQYVLIAAVIGTIQIAIICVVVLCITRSVSHLFHNRTRKNFFFSCFML